MGLAKMLDDALQTLRIIKVTNPEGASSAEENLNVCLAKIQFVSVYLANPDIPVPREEEVQVRNSTDEPVSTSSEQPLIRITEEIEDDARPRAEPQPTIAGDTSGGRGRKTSKSAQRPSLIDSSFSFMLGENRHRSSFVSSVADLPEQRRGSESTSEPKKKPKKKQAEPETHHERRGSGSEDGGFTLTSIQGGQG